MKAWLTVKNLHPIQRAFSENHALQCGFCTPGFIMLIAACLEQNPDPTDEEIRDMLSANLCRCTGYQNIINAVKQIVGRLPRIKLMPAGSAVKQYVGELSSDV